MCFKSLDPSRLSTPLKRFSWGHGTCLCTGPGSLPTIGTSSILVRATCPPVLCTGVNPKGGREVAGECPEGNLSSTYLSHVSLQHFHRLPHHQATIQLIHDPTHNNNYKLTSPRYEETHTYTFVLLQNSTLHPTQLPQLPQILIQLETHITAL